jgi:hypothetical protein
VLCLVRRTPGNGVRPRRLIDVIIRPLNFIVRGHDVRALALAVHWSLRPTLAT